MIEASAEKIAAMLEEARRQHPEENDGQHRKRVAYRLNALRKKDKIEVLHDRIAKMESQDWRWWLIIAMFGLFIILFGVSQAHCQIAPNVNIQRIAGTNIASGIYDSGNTAFKVNCVVGCSATASFSDNSAFTVGTTTINVIGGYYTSGAAPSLTTGNAGRARIDASSFLMVNCASGCSGGATTPADTFTNPTTAGLSMVFPAVWNGTTWDRLYGDKTNGAFVNVKTSVLPTGAALDASLTTLDTDVKANITLHAGTNVIGHVIADSGSTTAVTGNVAVTKADGSDVTLGAKADAKSTATDTTAITLMQVLKEISAMEQAPASRAVTNAGTFATQATLSAETTKVIGTVNLGTTPDQCGDGTAKTYAIYDAATNGATQMVALSSGKIVYVCAYAITSSSTTANTIKLVYGTGSNCATGQTAITPGVIVQAGTSTGPAGKAIPYSHGLQTIASNELCVLTNAAQAAQVEVSYVQQ